jgi:hypothetical protein
MLITVWGQGGYDPSKPNNNIIEQYEVEDPQLNEKEQARQSAIAKLRNLGLTDDEIKALVG